MDDAPVEFRRDGMLISTDRIRLDPNAILALLRTTFWARDMSRDVLVRAIANSVNFGLFDAMVLVGFGRAVTISQRMRIGQMWSSPPVTGVEAWVAGSPSACWRILVSRDSEE